MMKLLIIRCVCIYVDSSDMIFSLAFVNNQVGVSGCCIDLGRTTGHGSDQ